MSEAVWIAVVSVGGASLVNLLGYFANRRAVRAQADESTGKAVESLTNANVKLNQSLVQDVARLANIEKALRQELQQQKDLCLKQISELEKKLRARSEKNSKRIDEISREVQDITQGKIALPGKKGNEA